MTNKRNTSGSPVALTEKILEQCHNLYSEKENGLCDIAKSMGLFKNFITIDCILSFCRDRVARTKKEDYSHADRKPFRREIIIYKLVH